MTTFARIVGGCAVDLRIHASATELAAYFHPDWLATHPFIVVPDLDTGGKPTTHGASAVVDGGGNVVSVTNVAIAAPVVNDYVLSKSDFIDHCILQFGGVQRFGAVMAAAKTSTDGKVAAYIEKYNALPNVTKSQAQAFFTAIQGANLPAGSAVTVPEITAVVTNWPKG